MKAQPSIVSSRGGARINPVYPPPNKRASSWVQRVPTSSSVASSVTAVNLSPRSMAAASVVKRKSPAVARHTPPPRLLSQHAHERALAAQRNAVLAHKNATRTCHLSTLDRGIRLLLEEEYREEVKAWMLEKEKLTMANASAMDQQPELQWHMRGHLLDFLLEIHIHFRLRPETLYLTLSILDRYVSRRIVYKKHYQLVGCVALWLAAKFEDAKERVPSVKDLKELCNGLYEEGAFVQMEGHVLGTVDWDLGHPTAESWLRVLCTETHVTGVGYGMFGGRGALAESAAQSMQQPFEETKTQHVARFLLEMTLYSREYIQFPPSALALGSLCLARHVCGKQRRPADESPSVLHMISLLDHTLSANLDSVSQTLVKKYSFGYYSKASGIVVSFYLRGGRFPFNNSITVRNPESLETNVVSVEQLRVAEEMRSMHVPPVTPVRERMDVRWGSGTTDLEETPGLVRSDSSSSGMDVEEEEYEDARAFSEPREFDMEDDEEDDVGRIIYHPHHHHGGCGEFDDDDDDEEDEEIDDEYDIPIPSSSSSMMLAVPSSSGGESLPITPTTPMFQLDPFGTSQAHQHPVVAASSKDKENLVPSGHPHHLHIPHHMAMPCHPMTAQSAVNVVDGSTGAVEDEAYRQALLAIVP